VVAAVMSVEYGQYDDRLLRCEQTGFKHNHFNCSWVDEWVRIV